MHSFLAARILPTAQKGKTPALGDHQARALLHAPNTQTLKGKRDRAILSTLLYDTLRTKIQALSTEATRIRLGPDIQPARMKNYLLRIARELNVPVAVRKVSGGVVFWRATEEDHVQAQVVSQRLHKPQPKPQAPRRGRPRRT